MRHLIVAALLLLGAAGGRVLAQTAAPHAAPAPPLPSSREAVVAQEGTHEAAVADCVRMWDRGTHMSKQEWSRTCARVQDRLQNLQSK
jgi:hypothetical protein